MPSIPFARHVVMLATRRSPLRIENITVVPERQAVS
jgi:hypothetical protein